MDSTEHFLTLRVYIACFCQYFNVQFEKVKLFYRFQDGQITRHLKLNRHVGAAIQEIINGEPLDPMFRIISTSQEPSERLFFRKMSEDHTTDLQ